MADSNLDLFNTYAAQVFATFYEQFPVQAKLDAGDIIGFEYDPLEQGNKRIPREYLVFEATLDWLRESGYITYEGSVYQLLSGQMTHKGLEVMKALPAAIDNPEPLGDRLLSTIRDGSAQASRDLIATGLTKAFLTFGQGIY